METKKEEKIETDPNQLVVNVDPENPVTEI